MFVEPDAAPEIIRRNKISNKCTDI